jgi:hypothetical protein
MKEKQLEKMVQLSDYVQKSTANILPFILGAAVYALGMFTGISIDAVTQKIQDDMIKEARTNKQQVESPAYFKKTRPSIKQCVEKNKDSSVDKQGPDRLVIKYTGMSPLRGTCFYLKHGRKISYEYGSIAEELINEAVDVLDSSSNDEIFCFFMAADRDSDKIISGYEAKDALDEIYQEKKK